MTTYRTKNDQEFQFYAAIRELDLLIGRLLLAQTRDIGLTGTQWKIIDCIQRQGAQHQTQLADNLSISKSSLGKVTDKLVSEGWLCKHQNPSDRRERIVALDKTIDPIDKPIGIYAYICELALADLNKADRDLLIQLLDKVRTNLIDALE